MPRSDVVNWNEIEYVNGPTAYNQGPAGPQGPPGPTGPPGPPGTNGATGIQGDDGQTGPGWKVTQSAPQNGVNTGDVLGTIWYNSQSGQFWTLTDTVAWTWTYGGAVVGAQGNPGPQGPQGATGAPGPTGLTGPTGAQGPTGATGATGAQGVPGPTGSQGPQGSTGPAGAQGSAGVQGPVGPSSSVHEEFLPTAGSTTVVLSQTPQWILMLARAGVVQSLSDNNYSLNTSTRTITFTDALNGAERVIVDYASTGYTPVPPIDGSGINAGSITTTQIQDGTIATADLANAAVTNAKLGTDTARLNLLSNGGMEIWQRGNGAFSGNGVYTADRWATSWIGTDTASVQRETSVIDTTLGSGASLRIAFTLGTGAGASSIAQKVEDYLQLRGRSLTLSVRINVSTASAVRVAVEDSVNGRRRSGFHTGDGTFQTITVTAPIAATTTFVQAEVEFAASCTAYVDNAMLVVGSVPADYAPLHPADDLARCLRYYEVMGRPGASDIIVRQTNVVTGGGVGLDRTFRYLVTKPIVPTVTVVGTWTVVNVGQPGVQNPSVDGFRLFAGTTAAANDAYFLNSGGAANQCVTVEANP